MSSADRRAVLAQIIRAERIASQEGLAERLRARGFAVTQATVSRDLEALGALRGKAGGHPAYVLSGEAGGGSSALDRILHEWRLSVEVAGNLVIVRTRPGSAHAVGAALDEAGLEAVAGSIAGDDTLFLAIRDGHDSRAVAQRLAGDEPGR